MFEETPRNLAIAQLAFIFNLFFLIVPVYTLFIHINMEAIGNT